MLILDRGASGDTARWLGEFNEDNLEGGGAFFEVVTIGTKGVH